MIDVRDFDCVRAARPFRVAHRGGVITADSPENSMAAIALAARHGYAMVELDVMEAADAEPVLLHDGLYINCGVNKRVCDLSSEQITAIRYRASDQPVITLAQALDACARLGMGVMLDKLARDSATDRAMSEACLERVRSLLIEHGLANATVAIVDSSLLRRHLSDVALFPISKETYKSFFRDDPAEADGQFWFGWAIELPDSAVPLLHQRGLFGIVSINTFHYPHHAPDLLARQDIERLLAAGLDGFQIDSVFEQHFPVL